MARYLIILGGCGPFASSEYSQGFGSKEGHDSILMAFLQPLNFFLLKWKKYLLVIL